MKLGGRFECFYFFRLGAGGGKGGSVQAGGRLRTQRAQTRSTTVAVNSDLERPIVFLEVIIESLLQKYLAKQAKLGVLPTTPDLNTSAKVSRYKWEPYRDTNWWCICYFLPTGRAYFCKSIAIEMGGVSRHFSRISGSGVDVTLLTTFNSIHTRCIVKTSGFTRGVCKNRRFIKFKGFLVEFLENRRS